MSARRKKVISTEEIQFNHKPAIKEGSRPKWPNTKYNWVKGASGNKLLLYPQNWIRYHYFPIIFITNWTSLRAAQISPSRTNIDIDKHSRWTKREFRKVYLNIPFPVTIALKRRLIWHRSNAKILDQCALNTGFYYLRYYWYLVGWIHQTSSIRGTKSKTIMFLLSSCSCLCPIHWSKVLMLGALTTSKWSRSLLLPKVHLILEVWQFMELWQY